MFRRKAKTGRLTVLTSLIVLATLIGLTGLAYAATWQIETVDRTSRVGESSALALDGNGYPHISYFDGTNFALKYAVWDGTSWQIAIVDTESVAELVEQSPDFHLWLRVLLSSSA